MPLLFSVARDDGRSNFHVSLVRYGFFASIYCFPFRTTALTLGAGCRDDELLHVPTAARLHSENVATLLANGTYGTASCRLRSVPFGYGFASANGLQLCPVEPGQ